MEALFLHLLNMSLTASWLILAVLLVRVIFKKAPKALICLLWAIVAVRLLCPISFESVLSLVPSAEPIPQEILFSPAPSIDSGIPIVNEAVNPALSESLAPNPGDSVNPLQIVAAVAANVWILGVAAMLIYAVVSYIRVYRKVRIRMPLDARTCLCDDIDTPFIFGILRPQVFLPSSLSDADRSYVIAHEQAHLKRLDHVWKPLGFALLTVYWFNPLLWVAYIVLCRDIELACDEKVIRDMNREDTAAYTQALLHCSSKQKFVTACPLAFGESGVKARIKNALNYKKPAFWLILLAIVACIAVTVCFVTDPLKPEEPDSIGSDIEPEDSSPTDPLESYGDMDTIGSDSEFGGLSLSVETLDLNSENPTITICWKNDSNGELIYGEAFRLYRLENGQLVDTNLVENSAFHSIGYLLARRSKISKAYSLAGYNLSKSGIYRFESTVNQKDGDATSYKVWVDFNIADGALSLPLIPATTPYTFEDAILPDTDKNVHVLYPVIKSEAENITILNSFLKNNIESKIYELRTTYPRNSVISLHYTITYDDGTLISLLFEGTVTSPDGNTVNVAFTSCLAPGNGYTVNPESLFEMDDRFINAVRAEWWDLWGDTNHILKNWAELRDELNRYPNNKLAELLRDGKSADFGLSANGVLVVFRAKPSTADYVLFEIPYAANTNKYTLYTYNESPDVAPPELKLFAADRKFEFSFSSLSSYLPTGSYTLEDNVLTLYAGNGQYRYTFKNTDDGFVFDANASSEIPSYRYEENSEPVCPVPDGAVFRVQNEQPTTDARLNTKWFSEIGIPFAELSYLHGYSTATAIWYLNGGYIVELSDGSGKYCIGAIDNFDWAEGSEKHFPDTGERGEKLANPLPQPKPLTVITSIHGIKVSDLFLGLNQNVTPEELTKLYGVEHVTSDYTDMDQHYYCVFTYGEYRITIRTGSDHIITPDAIIDKIKGPTREIIESEYCEKGGSTVVDGKRTPHDWLYSILCDSKSCKYCGELVFEPIEHDYVDGYCIRCRAIDPDYAPNA